jgi:ketosteroid isomerase-like protein
VIAGPTRDTARMNIDNRVAVIRRFNEAWAEGDLETVLDCIHPDMEFDWTESMSPFRGVYRAHEGIRAYWEDQREAFDWFRPEIEEVFDCADDRLVTRNTVRGRARSGIELKAQGAMLWVVREGKIASGKLFQDVEDALGAARSAA